MDDETLLAGSSVGSVQLVLVARSKPASGGRQDRCAQPAPNLQVNDIALVAVA